MKGSLRRKILSSYLVLIVITLLSLTLLIKGFIHREFEAYITKNQKKLLESVAEQAEGYFIEEGKINEDMAYELGKISLTNGILLQFYDEKGNLIWCMHCISEDLSIAIFENIEANTEKCCIHKEGSYEEISTNVINNGKTLGRIVLGYYGPIYYTDADAAFITTINKVILMVSAIAIGLALLLGSIMASVIAKPLKSMVAQTLDMIKGNYHKKIQNHGKIKELEDLSSCINSLATHLEEQHEVRARLARSYSHELRTPLASLQSNLEAMIDGIWEPSEERLNGCRDEVIRLSKMITNIKKLVDAKENGELIQSTFDITSLVKKIRMNYEVRMAEKNLQLNITGDSILINADKEQLEQVFINYIDNAIKYTDEYGKIDIQIKENQESIRFTITDTGIGIQEESIPHVYEYLYRADSSRDRKTGGYGIGLSIVKTIIKAHGGEVFARSSYGKGSVFGFTLPISIKSPYKNDMIDKN